MTKSSHCQAFTVINGESGATSTAFAHCRKSSDLLSLQLNSQVVPQEYSAPREARHHVPRLPDEYLKKKKKNINRLIITILERDLKYAMHVSYKPSGRSLWAPVDSSLRVTKASALGKGLVSCSDKGVIIPMLMSINRLRANLW
ncbi:cell division control 6 [Striga asiatica]|uniref:Cell division control 6 n=1 Tax=Striga asiatica TaxID=4170 RepID=A0A5A7PPM4_STRAF|nr:cell division control 6 [Striga asiatica]